MTTHAELGARLLREAAAFFRRLGEQDEALKEQMIDNSHTFEQVAELLETDPTGVLDEP